jgi:hypothetical protein
MAKRFPLLKLGRKERKTNWTYSNGIKAAVLSG